MKKSILFFAIVGLFITTHAKAQFDISQLDQVMSLVKNGNQPKAADVLSGAVTGIETAAKSSKGQFGSKILGQLGGLSAMIPALKKGSANMGGLTKIISTVKMLFAAQKLSGLMNGNKFTGNSTALLSGVSALQAGLGGLGSNSAVGLLTNNLTKLTSKAGKLDKTGLFSGIGKKMISKKLGSSLGLLNNLL